MFLAKWASNNSFDCLKFNFPAFYYWPDFHHKTRGDSYAGTLHITPFSGVVERHPTRKALSYALCNFGGGVFEMPRAYSGMISSKLIDKIIKKYGFLFGGVSPDIFSSALISIESKDCYLVDYPVIIPGASGASTTGQSANGGHRGDLRNNPHISPFKDLVWDTRVPDFYSVPTVWSFSLLKAVEILNENDPSLNLKPDFSRLFLKCMIYHPNEISRLVIPVKEVIRTEGKFKFFFSFFCAIFFEFAWGVKRILNRLIARRVKKNVIVLNGLISTEAAAEQLRNLVRAQKNKLKI
ncbi:hypothetical protein [Deefgea sp. CFH1-16]|uniref:hypothetical protein n=1 Tax=Deefgea sp. CFH1-16 TaxID=2675457 RepID=UPI0015F76E36|nr:hypothetical protein [Deefgea sp. CFH1-16]MBM5573551.1 hypothetical protein [Deefgea sp. CFH1-16]